MEKLLSEIKYKVDILQNKLTNYNNKLSNKQEISKEEQWTNVDAFLLNDLLNICKYLYTISYNAALEQIKNNDNSVIENYCFEKKSAILQEIPKHRSKHVLRELKKDLENLERIIENKNYFIDSKKQYVVSYDMVLNGLSFSNSSAVSRQLKDVYFNQTLDSNYKSVLNDLLDGNLENYNKLGKIDEIYKILEDIRNLFDGDITWNINNKIENYLNNNLNNLDSESFFKEVSNYISKFIKYKDFLKEYGVQLPTLEGNYFKNVQTFLVEIKDKNVFEKISDRLKDKLTEISDSLPQEYRNIQYGFFGTMNGIPGIAYYYSDSDRLDEAKNIKYICETLVKAKELEGKNLGVDIVEQVNQNIQELIDSRITHRNL